MSARLIQTDAEGAIAEVPAPAETKARRPRIRAINIGDDTEWFEPKPAAAMPLAACGCDADCGSFGCGNHNINGVYS